MKYIIKDTEHMNGISHLPPEDSVKNMNSSKQRDPRLVNPLLERNISFVGLKLNSQVSDNLSKYIQNMVVAHKLCEVVFDVKPY